MSSIFNVAFLSVLASLVSADVYFLNTDWTGIAVGQPFSLHWAGEELPVNISLFHGPTDNMQFVRNITVNNLGKRFDYMPLESNFAGQYALRINQGDFTFSSPGFIMDALVAHLPETMADVILTMPEIAVPTAPSAIGTAEDESEEEEIPKLVIEITRNRAHRRRDQGVDGKVEVQDDDISSHPWSNGDGTPPLSYNPGGPIINATGDSPLLSALKKQVAPETSELASLRQEDAGTDNKEGSEEREEPSTDSIEGAGTTATVRSPSATGFNQSQTSLEASTATTAMVTTGPRYSTPSNSSEGSSMALEQAANTTATTAASEISCHSFCSSSSATGQTSMKTLTKPSSAVSNAATSINDQASGMLLSFGILLIFTFTM